MRFVLGIDIGGTNLVVGSVAEDGSRILATRQRADPRRGRREATCSTGWWDWRSAPSRRPGGRRPAREILGVGVGAPGPLDTRRGIVLLTPNLGWVNLPLRQIIHDRLGLPAALDNDANCAVLGEWWVGAARGATHGHRHHDRHRASAAA